MQNKVNNTVGAYTAQISAQQVQTHAITQAIKVDQHVAHLQASCTALSKRLSALATCNDAALHNAHKQAIDAQLGHAQAVLCSFVAEFEKLEKAVQAVI